MTAAATLRLAWRLIRRDERSHEAEGALLVVVLAAQLRAGRAHDGGYAIHDARIEVDVLGEDQAGSLQQRPDGWGPSQAAQHRGRL